MKINLPTQLTLLRLLLIPFFLVFVVQDNPYARLAATVIFIGASLTDLYDGRLARARGQVTIMGTFLDPLADKLLISAAFIVFVQVKEFYVPAWMIVLIIGREFLITGLRTLAISQGRVLPAQPAGKFKTTFQLVAIITTLVFMTVHAMIGRYGPIPLDFTLTYRSTWKIIVWLLIHGPYWLTAGAALLTVVSGYIYIHQNIDLLHDKQSYPK